MNKENKFRNIYEHSKIPIFVVDVEAAGDFIFSSVNPAFEKATGLCKEDVVDKRIEAIPDFSTESSAALLTHCQRCLEGDEDVCFDWFIRGHGQGTWWMTQLAPLPDTTGKIVRIMGTSANITDRKRTGERLKKSQGKLSSILENIGLGVSLISPGMEILEMNRQMQEWYPDVDLSENPFCFQAFHDKRQKDVCDNCPVHKTLQDGMPYEATVERSLAGEIRNFRVVSSPIFNVSNEVEAVVSMVEDITESKLAEETMFRSGQRLRLHRELSPLGFLEWDENFRAIEWNSACERIFGYTREEAIGRHAKELILHKEVHDLVDGIYRDLMNRTGGQHSINKNITKDGRIIICEWFNTTLVDKNGKSIGVASVCSDITERIQAEEALRLSEEEKAILNQIANVFLTIPDDAIYGEILMIVLRVMKSKLGIFGYIAENGDLIIPSLTGEAWSECRVPGKSIVFSPDSWGNSLWGRAMRKKKTFRSDGPFHVPDGHIQIESFLSVPLIYGQGAIGIISLANKEGGYTEKDEQLLERIASSISSILHARLQRAIEEKKRMAAERNLKESEEKYRLLITNAGEAIFIVQDEVVKFPNPRLLEMTGYSAQELAEIPFVDLIHPGDKETVIEGYLRLNEGGRHPRSYPFRIKDKKGEEMWIQLTTAPIAWEKKPGILCFLRDITEEKKLEAQFIQAQKMEAVGRLAGGVAHDFNNMLTAIIGYAELTLMKTRPSDPLCAPLKEIDKAARRSANLTRQLLAFARKQTIAPRILNLNDTVSGMLNMLQRLIGENIELVWWPRVGLWPVKMDSSQIDQVLANLCVNARDAIPGMGKIIVKTENITIDEAYCTSHAGFVPGEYVLLAVSDDGCGMDEETQQHLFEPFFTTKGRGVGTGLGLATVHGIVKQNKGFINVYSEPGHGATFNIYFPRDKTGPVVSQVENGTVTSPGKGETVLIVDDEKMIVDFGKKVLEESGYTVLTATSPREAIHLAEKHTGDIHLLLTDVVMPEMNGQDLAARIVSIKPNLKWLFMSGYTADVIAHRGVLEEGIHFVHKPFSMKDLLVRVREVLDH